MYIIKFVFIGLGRNRTPYGFFAQIFGLRACNPRKHYHKHSLIDKLLRNKIFWKCWLSASICCVQYFKGLFHEADTACNCKWKSFLFCKRCLFQTI